MTTSFPTVHRLLGAGFQVPAGPRVKGGAQLPAVTLAVMDAIVLAVPLVVPPENFTEPPTKSAAAVESVIDLGSPVTGV